MKYKPIWALMVLATAGTMMIVSCGGPAPWDASPYATRIYMLAAQQGNLTPLDPADDESVPAEGVVVAADPAGSQPRGPLVHGSAGPGSGQHAAE